MKIHKNRYYFENSQKDIIMEDNYGIQCRDGFQLVLVKRNQKNSRTTSVVYR